MPAEGGLQVTRDVNMELASSKQTHREDCKTEESTSTRSSLGSDQCTDPDDHENMQDLKKRKRLAVQWACNNCKKAKTSCDDERPCRRCQRLGLQDCMDSEHRRRGRNTARGRRAISRNQETPDGTSGTGSSGVESSSSLQFSDQQPDWQWQQTGYVKPIVLRFADEVNSLRLLLGFIRDSNPQFFTHMLQGLAAIGPSQASFYLDRVARLPPLSPVDRELEQVCNQAIIHNDENPVVAQVFLHNLFSRLVSAPLSRAPASQDVVQQLQLGSLDARLTGPTGQAAATNAVSPGQATSARPPADPSEWDHRQRDERGAALGYSPLSLDPLHLAGLVSPAAGLRPGTEMQLQQLAGSAPGNRASFISYGGPTCQGF